jgi:hypothetical protein
MWSESESTVYSDFQHQLSRYLGCVSINHFLTDDRRIDILRNVVGCLLRINTDNSPEGLHCILSVWCFAKGKVVPVLILIKHYATKTYGEWKYRSTFFFTSAVFGGQLSASRPSRFTPGERAPGTHWIGGWVSPRAGLDDVEKRKFLTVRGLELRPLCCPARSQSLYRLSYILVDV